MTARNSMPASNQAARHPLPGGNFSGRCSRHRHHGTRGVTIVEAMVATTIFTMGILGVYAMLIYSYNMETLARHRDNGRAVLMSFADKFERLQTTDPAGNLRNFFDTSVTTPNGIGLTWTDNTGTITAYNSTTPATVPNMTWINADGTTGSGTGTGIQIMLGDSASAQVPAIVTELVQNVNQDTGALKTTGGNQAAGRVLQATFTINYTVKGRNQQQTLVVARSVR
jgi:Tfp pilus assembly protein PilV